MKKRNLFVVSAFCALMSLTFIGCDEKEEKPGVPTEVVTGVTFADTDMTEGKMAGTLSWKAPESVSQITKYVIYASADGKGKDAKLGEVPAGTTTFKVEDGTTFSGYILIVACNAQGESEAMASLAVVDVKKGIPTEVVTEISFTDEDALKGKISGTVSWKAPASATDITKYVIYLSADGNNRETKLGEVAVGVDQFVIEKNTDWKAYVIVVVANEKGEAATAANVLLTDKVIDSHILVLNSGKMGNNNAGVSSFNILSSKVEIDVFNTINGRGLGDTTNDMLRYGSKVYIAGYGSGVIEVMDLNGKSIKQIKSANAALQPRNFTSYEGKVYVSLFDGYVARLDTATLEIEEKIKVGRNPEQLVVANKKLYVANSGGLDYNTPVGYDKTVSVIDVATFKEIKKIEVVTNPVGLQTDNQGDVYLVSMGDYGAIPNTFQRIDSKTDQVKTITETNATEIACDGKTMYILFSQYDANWNQTISFISYDAMNEKVISTNFITDGTTIKKPYKLGVDQATGHVYITSSDYKNNGDLYVFNSAGKKQYQFETGLNPLRAVFVQ